MSCVNLKFLEKKGRYMDKISVIVPCFNEEDVVQLFHETITKVLDAMPVDYELLFINDGSKDHTEDILKLLSMKDAHCYYFSFSRNFGKEAAMYAGLKNATGNYVVIMDADLQHPCELLVPMYEAVSQEGYDCCAGKRMDRKGENQLRNVLSHLFYKVINRFASMEMADGAGDFRMMNRKMVDAILELKEYNRYMKGIFSFVGFDTKWIQFHNVERAGGKTKWNFKSLFKYALEGIFSFSNSLIFIASLIGIIFLGLSLALMIYIIVQCVLYNGIASWIIILTFLFMISGVQVLCISLVGQYCAKDYMETKQRPVYIIKETNRV